MSAICRHCREPIRRCDTRGVSRVGGHQERCNGYHAAEFRCRGWSHATGWHACTAESAVVTSLGTYAEPDPLVLKIKEALLV